MNSGQPATWLIMVAILVLIGVVCMLFGRRTRGLALGLLVIGALGMVYARLSVRPAPAPAGWAHPLDVQPPEVPHPVARQPVDWHEVVPQEPIESLWTKLTAPKINLEQPAAPAGEATQPELANAAKVILSASAPGADPFTQGWLINAAKAILNAAPQAVDGEGKAVATEIVATSQAKATDDSNVETKSFSSSTGDAPNMAFPAPLKVKPDWIDNPPKLVGNTRRVVVSTDPYSTVAECHVALRENLRNVVQARVHELALAANSGGAVQTPALDTMGISIEYILSELCPEDDYIETIDSSVGEMKRAHALVEFNEAQDRFLLDRWRDYARVESLEIVGGLLAFVVAGLAFVYGLLRVDTWTRGYYSKRLFLGVPAIIIFFGLALVNFFTD